LHNISDDVQAKLRKASDRCPGLQLIAGSRRQYDPVAAVTAEHVLGNMTLVPERLMEKNDPFAATEPLRKYYERDQIGGSGLERLAEPILRGSRGEKEYVSGSKDPRELVKPVPGRDVRTTIDLNLQQAVADALKKTYIVPDGDLSSQTFSNLHGAAVVIKVDGPDNQILAMVSNPGFELNRFDEEFETLRRDNLNKPLLNRATQQAFQPGSAVKTAVGAIAAKRGFVTTTEGIECNGYLKTPDRAHPGSDKWIEHKQHFKCWSIRFTQYSYEQLEHHQQPAPHKGLYGNKDGWLCMSDALERSCNVYFETVADRMRLDGVVDALETFGLHKPTGIGISESIGTMPKLTAKADNDELCWSAGIGEGDVSATPLQMADVAATLARNGVWMRPKLLLGDAADSIEQSERAAGKLTVPNVVNLQIPSGVIEAIRLGMDNVVNHQVTGTGKELHMDDLDVAGKTGSAQIDATDLEIPVLDADGKPVREPDTQGHPGRGPIRKTIYKPGDFPWFQGTGEKREHLAHAWFIGFAPAQKPRIAFCVLVEYGGSGGRVAGPVAKEILKACQTHHYLDATKPTTKVAAYGQSSGELLHPQ
jgi:penicillin-binding protein 2